MSSYDFVNVCVCVCIWGVEYAKSVVGEIQFLLRVMLNLKKKDHELYQIERHDTIVRQAFMFSLKATFEERIMTATKLQWPQLALQYPLKFNIKKHYQHLARSVYLNSNILNYLFPLSTKGIGMTRTTKEQQNEQQRQR